MSNPISRLCGNIIANSSVIRLDNSVLQEWKYIREVTERTLQFSQIKFSFLEIYWDDLLI